MKPTVLRSWAGLIAIAWMVGIFERLDYPPHMTFFNVLFGIENSSQLSLFADLFVWLGVGLIFAIAGLRCGKSAGQVCATIAICIFIYFAWHLLGTYPYNYRI
ncbi:MAG TPA: hypothetical protein VIK53_01195 [Verrucomicrobiae bacterium]